MPYEIEVVVNDVDTVKLLYNEVHLYRFDSETETDAGNGTEITQMVSPPTTLLDSSYTIYIFIDAPGDTETYWYRARYEDPVGVAPTYSSFSDPIRGGVTSRIFHDISYPDEVYLSTSESTTVGKIRILIGDRKQLMHDYIGSCKSRLSDNEHTIEMKDKGWPVYINLNGTEKTRVSDPYVDGYRYLTFSGSIVSTDVLDIYCYTFRNSDSSIYDSYNKAMIPAGLTTTTVTSDHLILQTSIDLLEAENWEAYNDEGAYVKDGDTVFNPTPGFNAREKAIERLKKRLDDLVLQYFMVGGSGVLID